MGFHNPFLKDGLIGFPTTAAWSGTSRSGPRCAATSSPTGSSTSPPSATASQRDLNWADFSVRNRAVGARLQQVTQPGDRVAILCPQNLDYLVAFFGTLYAGRIAVPLFDPSEPGHVGRLHAVLDDCQPTAILTTTDSAEGVRKFFRSRPAKERPRVIAVDAVPDEVGATWEHVDVTVDTIAYLQYTSGSTRIPTGVQITHLNLATNVVQVIEALDGEEGDRGVTWLPFFHDMGLITAMVAPMIGHYVTFMTPAAFVRRPGRWIREMARKPDDTGGVISVAPNFAFDHAAARGLPKEGESRPGPVQRQGSPQRQRADLGRHRAPVQRGVRPRTASSRRRIKPSYGLAEATLFVSTTPMGEPPKIVYVDRDELNNAPLRRGARGRAERRRAGVGAARSASPSGPSSSTPSRPPSCPTGRSARSGSAARTWAPATGASRRRPSRPSRTSSSRGPTRRTPRARPTTRPGCAPATTAPSTTATSTSPAASRIW